MIFEDWELDLISNTLQESGQIMSDTIRDKIEKLRLTSVNKRYTLRTTDWLVEAGKKRKNRKSDLFGELL